MKKIKKIILLILEIIFIALMIFSLVMIIKWFVNTRKTKSITNEINTKINVEEIRDGKNDVDFDYLTSINKDTVGYIMVDGLSINYPVVQTSNNDYYLNHSFDKSKNSAGWIYMDYRNDSSLSDRNTVIYGHNMKDGSMFGKLKVLKKNTPTYITYITNNSKVRYKMFSIYEIEGEEYYIKTSFNSDYKEFLETITNRSLYDYGYEVKEDDSIITLSTCSSAGKRLVIHAYKVN